LSVGNLSEGDNGGGIVIAKHSANALATHSHKLQLEPQI
jgi:hypothetical protein